MESVIVVTYVKPKAPVSGSDPTALSTITTTGSPSNLQPPTPAPPLSPSPATPSAMDYNQGHPYDSSRPQPSYYGPYPHHYAAASSYYHQPPPPGTERTAPAAASSSSSAAEASYDPANGMNPAAAASALAALTQLPDFAASMGTSERAMGHQAYPPQYPPAHHPNAVGGIGTLMGGRRGGGPSRGGGRGRGSSTYRRGRGWGSKVSGRQLPIHAQAVSSAAEAQPGTAPAPAQIQAVGQVTTANIAQGRVRPVAWCDICRVECNSMKILEQHKNGKRHKRTVQRMQEMAGLEGMTPAIPDMVTPASQLGGSPEASNELAEGRGPSTALHMVPPVGSSSHGGEEHKNMASENATAAVARVQVPEATTGNSAQQNTVPSTMAVGHSVEAQIELHAAVVQAHQPANEMKEGGDAPSSNATSNKPSNVQSVGARLDGNSSRNGPKRKTTTSNRSGKKPRTSEAPRRKPERVREQPLVCTLCNVTCDTRAVFDIHLGGKKHLSRLKRSQGADTVFGPLVVYIPPNQPVAHAVGAPEPVFYGLKSRDMVEQEAYLLGAMQQPFPILPHSGQASMAAEGTQVTSGATYDVQQMAGAMENTEKAGPGTEQVGNHGMVTASSGSAAVETDAKEAPPPA